MLFTIFATYEGFESRALTRDVLVALPVLEVEDPTAPGGRKSLTPLEQVVREIITNGGIYDSPAHENEFIPIQSIRNVKVTPPSE